MYNKYMGGVDRFDENVDSMRVALRGKKWWFPLFAFGLDASCQNAWLIKRNSENNWTYCDFRRNVATIYLQKYGKSPTRNSACGVPVQIRVPTEKKFTEETLKKCKEVAEYRSKKQRVSRKSIYSEIEVPRGVDTDIGYHSACYKNFTAVRIPKDSNISHDNVVSNVRCIDIQSEVRMKYICNISLRSVGVNEEPEGDRGADESTTADDSALADDSTVAVGNTIPDDSAVTDVADNTATDDSTADENTHSCIICGKYRIYVKRRAVCLIKATNTFIEFIKAVSTEYNIEMLRKIETLKDDNCFYHKHCKTKFEWHCKNDLEKKKEKTWHKKRQCHTDAYDKICILIRERVVENNECLFYNFISEKYIEFLHEQFDNVSNVEKPDFFSSRHLEKKLLVTFNAEIKIIFSNNKKYIAPYAGHIVSNQEFSKNIETRQAIYNIGQIIRREIINADKTKLPEDITVQDLIRGECDSVPPLLSYLLQCIICGDSKGVSQSRHELKKSSRDLKMFSLGQDIIYAATNGNIKTSKHVTLGMALKSLSSSRKIVDLVNKYVAFDNFDRFVDTLTGKDTLHDTVGIIYQNILSDANFTTPTDASVQSDDTAAASTDETPRRRKRRRCFDAIVNEIVPYAKKPKIDSYFSTPSIGQISIKPEVFKTWRNLDLAWLFSHKLDIPDTPMWTGFNSLITEDTSALQKVSYLTPINASPTDNSVVHLTLKMAQ
ncbi:Chimeric ERCC6-PGBD3 protein [Eumeta japonica]|uniref:Chimeric ERCC6-PGBD3 protein n=1 Tax=Eumeta variegata TaxID=151549 RepID=A0A4C1Y6Y8_EUMVA|nr:Chimeric ERCC6-PGBD3 protein [Eumeta japonica]